MLMVRISLLLFVAGLAGLLANLCGWAPRFYLPPEFAIAFTAVLLAGWSRD